MDYTVQVNVTVHTAPPSLEFQWPLDTASTMYTVSRKLATAAAWTIIGSNLPGNSTGYSDTAIAIGDAYEYRISKISNGITAFTYTYSGIEAPAIEQRGKIILLVDSVFSMPLLSEIKTLMDDLEGDGWFVIRHDVSRTDSVPYVKSLIVNEYNSDPVEVKAVFILGHVPVPYSGNIAPDGHSDHYGAWPADIFYGEVNNTWTDATVNATTASRPQNINIPGDGKFDQSSIPGDVELEVGRVDFFDLPAFSFSEEELMRKYLEKDHAYRQKLFSVRPRALVDDNFGTFGGEAFGSNGWRLAALVGTDSVSSQDYFTTLNTENYQWSYGCGGGSYTSCGGVGNTTDFTIDSVQTIFSMLFGSYFGDWDSQNNFMRSSLASGTTLTCSWAGRPHWQYHHMGLGKNIGYSAYVSQNNNGTYVYNFPARSIHIALMGDPTLRMHIIAPPSVLIASVAPADQVMLTWNSSPDSVLGYYVYRLDTSSGFYNRISPAIITATSFYDTAPQNNSNRYMVRAVRLEHAASGTYYNLSEGIIDTVSIQLGTTEVVNPFSRVTVYPNPSQSDFTVAFISTTTKESSLEILDVTGKIVFSKNYFIATGYNDETIPGTFLSPGIYLLRIDGSSMNTRLVVIE
ncbi:hypothetical protein BH11BAC1_BH11BAC1_03300 [soil metagenome]